MADKDVTSVSALAQPVAGHAEMFAPTYATELKLVLPFGIIGLREAMI